MKYSRQTSDAFTECNLVKSMLISGYSWYT